MVIEKHETNLIGSWKSDEGKVIEDDVSKRIEFLISNYLKEISTEASGWDTLYQDPNDDRYWELTYPNSELHGGGPASLINISLEAVKNKYNL